MRLGYFWIIRLLLFCLALALAYYFHTIVLYIITAVVLTLISRPVFDLYKRIPLGKYRMPDTVCALLAVLTLYGSLGWLVYSLVPVLYHDLRALGGIDPKAVLAKIEAPLQEFRRSTRVLMPGTRTQDGIIMQYLGQFFDAKTFSRSLNDVIGMTGSLMVGTLASTFIAFNFLRSPGLMGQIVLTLTPHEHEEAVSRVMVRLRVMLMRYFIGLFIQVSIVACLLMTGFYIVGSRNILVPAIFSACLVIIPYLGPLIGFVFTLLVVLAGHLDLDFNTQLMPLLLRITFVFGLVQTFDGFVSQPTIFSNTVKAHPLEIFLVILIAAQIGGVLGMMAAIPTYTVLRVIGKEFLSQYAVVAKLTRNM